jgi:hypothetical protein
MRCTSLKHPQAGSIETPSNMKLLLLIAFICGATAVTLDDLLCATNITANGVNVPDESALLPLITMSKQVSTSVFEITDTSLAAQVFVNIVKSSISFTPYDYLDDVTGSVLLLADVLTAVTFGPGAYPGCVDVTGCDGIQFDGIVFRKLFPSNTSYVVFACKLQYSSDGPVTAMSPFMTLGIAPKTQTVGDTILGTSDFVSTNISFPATITPTAGAASSSTTLSAGAWAGIGVAIFVALIPIVALIWCMHGEMSGKNTSTRKRGTRQEYGRSSSSTELQDATGGSFYGAKFNGNLNHRLNPHSHARAV